MSSNLILFHSLGITLCIFLMIVNPSWSVSLLKECPSDGKEDKKILKSPPLVSILKSNTTANDNNNSTVQFHCSANYPIQWTFDLWPNDWMRWNVTYLREAESILKRDSYKYNSTLTFLTQENNVVQFGPSCRNVEDVCQFTRATLDKKGNGKNGTTTSSTNATDAPSGGEECTLDLWYDALLHLFVCKINNGKVLPKMSFRYCSNPTECGFEEIKKNNCSKTIQPEYKHCFEPGVICTTLSDGIESNLPKIVSCWDGQNEMQTQVEIFDYPLFDVTDGRALAFNEGPNGDRVQIEISNRRPIALEPFEVACTASYFYFASGLYITLKHLSTPSFTKIDIGSCPYKLGNCSKSLEEGIYVTVQETIEFRNQSKGIPVKRTLLVQGLTLYSGDWEITCYSPVWNTSQWTSKSLLFPVIKAILPKFLAGSTPKDIKYKPKENITCMARGVPLPKITWIYQKELLQDELIYIVDGQQDDITWSILTMPDSIPGNEFEFKCHAQNLAGFVEKMFVIKISDEEYLVVTKIAAALVIVLGIMVNVIVVYCCWKILYTEKDHDHTKMNATKFLRHLVIFRKCPTLHHHHSNTRSIRSTNGLCINNSCEANIANVGHLEEQPTKRPVQGQIV